jgi:hypothetical protein
MSEERSTEISGEHGNSDDFDSPSPVGQVRIGCSTCRRWGFSPRELVKHITQARAEHSSQASA